jgi:hypothetical protein
MCKTSYNKKDGLNMWQKRYLDMFLKKYIF